MNEMSELIQFNNLFGVNYMQSLEVLDLKNNHFNSTITIKGFKSLSSNTIHTIIMSYSKISSIDSNAFEPISKNLRFLDLSFNYLQTLPENIFNSILSSDNRIHLQLYSNYWDCNCNLKELIDNYAKYREYFIGKLLCHTPVNFHQKEIHTVDILNCKQNSSTETISSTMTTNTLTILNPNNILTINCSSQSRNFLNSKYLNRKQNYINILRSNYEFSIKILSKTSVKILIENLKQDLMILWYDNVKNYKTICIKIITDDPDQKHQQNISKIVIDHLKSNKSYVFCIIPEGETKISPFNCLSIYIPTLMKRQQKYNETSSAALIQKHPTIVSLTICLIILLAICFGGGISYVIIQKYPILLKNSKNIIIIKKTIKN